MAFLSQIQPLPPPISAPHLPIGIREEPKRKRKGWELRQSPFDPDFLLTVIRFNKNVPMFASKGNDVNQELHVVLAITDNLLPLSSPPPLDNIFP
jgi:hypothetical protein